MTGTSAVFSIKPLSGGRQSVALQAVKKRAETEIARKSSLQLAVTTEQRILGLTNVALEEGSKRRKYRAEWIGARGKKDTRPELQPFDVVRDRCVSVLRKRVKEVIQDETASPELIKQTEALDAKLFPNGVPAIINAPLHEESDEIGRILDELRALPTGTLEAMDLVRPLRRLEEAQAAFVTAAAKVPEPRLPYKVYKAQEELCYELLCGIVSVIWSAHLGRDPAVVAERNAWLEPIFRELAAQERHRAAKRADGSVADEDDEDPTGEDPEPAPPS